ncbi:MAG: ParB/RepB/Spo0J family partition protein [Bradymonadia bacterium]
MTQSRTVLGRGLSALIPTKDTPEVQSLTQTGLIMVPLEQIQAAPRQPRTHFDADKLDELAQSIARDGLLQPIVLRLVDDNEYTIIAGERRYRAAHRAGLHEIPAIIKETTAAQAFEWAVIENIQREDLNPIEEAQAYQLLKEASECSQEELAQRLGKSRVTIANALRLLKLSSAIKRYLEQGDLSSGHARALLMAPSQTQLGLAKRAVEESWTVRKTEDEARRLAQGLKQEDPKTTSPSRRHEAVEAQLRAAIGAPVKVVQKKGKGRIEVRFHSFDELERLIELFSTMSEA